MRLDFRHLFPCDAETLWAILADPDYQAEASRRAKVSKEMLEDRRQAGVRITRVRVTPQRKLPPAMARAIGRDSFSYVQEMRWRDSDFTAKWSVIPDALAERVRCRGDFKVADRARGECERHITGELSVLVPLVGKRMEKRTAEDLQRSYDATAELLREWIARRSPAD